MDDPADDRYLLKELMTWLTIFDIVAFSYILIFDIYMVVKYLIYGKKHEITYLVPFYSLTFALATFGIC